jgi:hypothetical protein
MTSSARGPFLVIISLLLAVANAQWEIGDPVKAFQGLTVKMDYKVKSARKPEEVVIKYYKDETCEVPVTFEGSPNNEPYFNADVYNGVSNGDGTKMVSTKIFYIYMQIQCRGNYITPSHTFWLVSGSDECGY